MKHVPTKVVVKHKYSLFLFSSLLPFFSSNQIPLHKTLRFILSFNHSPATPWPSPPVTKNLLPTPVSSASVPFGAPVTHRIKPKEESRKLCHLQQGHCCYLPAVDSVLILPITSTFHVIIITFSISHSLFFCISLLFILLFFFLLILLNFFSELKCSQFKFSSSDFKLRCSFSIFFSLISFYFIICKKKF